MVIIDDVKNMYDKKRVPPAKRSIRPTPPRRWDKDHVSSEESAVGGGHEEHKHKDCRAQADKPHGESTEELAIACLGGK